MPSKELPPNTDLRRAPLLAAQVEIAIAAGDIDRARSAAAELAVVAARFQSKPLCASAALAHGRVHLAEDNVADGERFLSEAVRLWSEVGAPYEAALARIDLAAAFRAGGAGHRAVLEFQAARTILDRIEAVPQTDPAVPLAARDGPEERATRGPDVFRREGDYWSVVFDARCGCVTSRACGTSRLLADRGREFHVLDLVAAEAGRNAQSDGGRAAGLSRALGDSGEILTHEPRMRTDDASSRSKRTSSRRRRSGTSNVRRRPTLKATSLFKNCRARLASVVEVDEPDPRPSVLEPG